ncbi:Atxe2 family lasso peptide isopeptidase [Sphingomonas agri]|uniref:Atxe2 family lasso peptide isopeptidase n=1 Tax=Sphingomonas agri TaxID=1813878 RepID=UPI00311EE819
MLFALCASDTSRASVTVRDLVELTDIDSLSMSPDGRFAAFRTERADVALNTYVLRWHVVDLRTGTVRDIGSGGDPIYLDPGSVQPESALWASDNHTIILRALIDGRVGLWRADAGGEGLAPLVLGDANVISYSLSPDRASVLYEVGATRDEIARAERREYDSGILVDPTVDLAENLYRGASIDGRMSSQRFVGYWFVRDGLLWQSPRQKHRIELASGKDVATGPAQAVPLFTLPSWPPPLSAANERGDVALASRSGGKGMLKVTLAGGRVLSCNELVCTSSRISSLAWRPGSNDLLVTFIDPEMRQSLFLWNTGTGRLRKLAGAQGLLSGGRRNQLPCAISHLAAVCVSAAPASPPAVEKVDLDTGARTLLYDPNRELRSAYRPQVDYRRWNIGDGREAAAVLMRPAGPATGALPLYLNYYTCEGFLRGGEGNEWPIPQLLDAGFAVACINSVPFTPPQDAVLNYEAGLAAVRSLVNQLWSEKKIDRSRIGMGGLSFGSEVAFWVAFHSDLLAALSVTSPQPEPGSYWLSAIPGSDIPARIRQVWGYGTPFETPERWKRVSPALNVERIRIPVLFQMPEMEARRVPELYARLAAQGTPTELYAFPDEAHIKVQPRHRMAAYERNLDWFKYWLQDYRDPDPKKADQYGRWDILRSRWKARPVLH